MKDCLRYFELNGVPLYASNGIADGLEQPAGGLSGSGPLMRMYESLVLWPKATSQIAKISLLLNPIIPIATSRVLGALNIKSELRNFSFLDGKSIFSNEIDRFACQNSLCRVDCIRSRLVENHEEMSLKVP